MTSEESKKLKQFRRSFRKLAKYFESVTPGYSFKFVEGMYASRTHAIYLMVRKPKSKKWVFVDSYPRQNNNYLEAYEDMFKFLCRNMAIKFDDYPSVENDDTDNLTCTLKESRVRRFIRIPCYENLVDMIMKLGLKGIDIS